MHSNHLLVSIVAYMVGTGVEVFSATDGGWGSSVWGELLWGHGVQAVPVPISGLWMVFAMSIGIFYFAFHALRKKKR
jgi:hypothetical protein